MNKAELLAFLRENPAAFVATIEDGAPRVRAMSVYRTDEEGILIQTWKNKDLSKQLYKNPEAELCFNNIEAGLQVRVRGTFEPLEDAAVLEQVIKDRPFMKPLIEKGKEAALFILKGGRAHTWTMGTNFATKTFTKL